MPAGKNADNSVRITDKRLGESFPAFLPRHAEKEGRTMKKRIRTSLAVVLLALLASFHVQAAGAETLAAGMTGGSENSQIKDSQIKDSSLKDSQLKISWSWSSWSDGLWQEDSQSEKKPDAPSIKSAKSSSPENVKITYAKNSRAAGYEIQYSMNKTFKKALTAEAKGSSASAQLLNVKPGKKYYIRMRSYDKNGSVKNYSEWSRTVSAKVKKGSTIVNAKSYMAIEADVKLNGSGTGCHAKLVLATPHSAVSYGIQYDKHAEAPYTGKAMAMIENVSTNSAGGQRYTRPGNKSLKLNKTYHLMLTVDKNGNGNVYLDYAKIGSFSQPNLAKETCYLRIEASARLNGDSVDATFSNIKCKWDGSFDPSRVMGQNLGWTEFKQNAGLKYTEQKGKGFRIFGTIQGIAGDWDSDYNSVSEILQFK